MLFSLTLKNLAAARFLTGSLQQNRCLGTSLSMRISSGSCGKHWKLVALFLPSVFCWMQAKMDKLKKVLSGDDEDEERGIVAEVKLNVDTGEILLKPVRNLGAWKSKNHHETPSRWKKAKVYSFQLDISNVDKLKQVLGGDDEDKERGIVSEVKLNVDTGEILLKPARNLGAWESKNRLKWLYHVSRGEPPIFVHLGIF